MLDIDDLIDLTSMWFYIPIISVLLFGLIGIFINSRIYNNKSNEKLNVLLFIILLAGFLLDLSIYIVSIRKCSHIFISYFFSIYMPLLLVFITIINSIFSIFKSINKFRWTIEAIVDFIPQSFFVITIKICFGLAYGSLSSIIWILFDFIITLVKTLFISERFEITYDKKLD